MNFLRFFFFILLSVFLSISCAEKKPTPIQVLAQQETSIKTHNTYDSYLSLEYLTFSKSLQSANDEKTAQHFAQKGLAILAGEIVVPENPLKWQADPSQIEEMVLMQKRLESALSFSNIKIQLPIQTAHLTYLYDCWITRESKAIFRADELAPCRVRFYKLLGEIDSYISDLQKDKTPKIVIVEPKFDRFEILFDLDNYRFNDRANSDLVKILKYLATMNGDYHILLVGNADRTGKELYNQSLALRRAEVVKNYLIKNGVSESQIDMRSVGEDFPDIVTKNGIQEQVNRTVGIYVLRGYPSFSKFPLPLLENIIYKQEIKKAKEAKE